MGILPRSPAGRRRAWVPSTPRGSGTASRETLGLAAPARSQALRSPLARPVRLAQWSVSESADSSAGPCDYSRIPLDTPPSISAWYSAVGSLHGSGIWRADPRAEARLSRPTLGRVRDLQRSERADEVVGPAGLHHHEHGIRPLRRRRLPARDAATGR